MIKNYIKIAWRNLVKNRVFTTINIIGLTTGLTCCFLISLYIYHEVSYDNYHKNAGRIYQLGTVFINRGEESRAANTPALMGQTMLQEFPEIEKTTKLMELFVDDKTLLQYKKEHNEVVSFYETKGYMADSSFFEVFSYNFKEGNALSALKNPNSVVLSAEVANKIFGSEPALNKVLTIKSSTNGDYDFKVTGVFIPSKVPSHIDARFIFTLKGGYIEQYLLNATNLANNNMFFTYLLLKAGSSPAELEKKFPAFIEKFAGNDLRASGFYKKQFLIPLRDIHLDTSIRGNVTEAVSASSLYIVGSIAVFTLLIAVINFMNLSTARSSKRSAEVGIRKVLGAEKGSLIRLFIGESILTSLLAFVFALGLTQALFKFFSGLTGKNISFVPELHLGLLGGFLLLAIFTGILAGSYPAFYLSSFLPVKTLKGKSSGSFAAASLRKVLVVFQFMVSVILIISTAVITDQMNYVRSKDLGFQKDQQVVIPLRSETARGIYPSLKNELRRIPEIRSAAGTHYYPGIMNPSDMMLFREGETSASATDVIINYVDYNLLETLGIKPLAGRMFSEQFPADTNNRIVINEECLKKFHFNSPEEAVGKRLNHNWRGETNGLEIIGVVKNFHFQGFREAIDPYGFRLIPSSGHNYMIAHVSAADVGNVIKSVRDIWQKLNPGEPFEYSFLDEDFYRNYESENRLYSIINSFTVIAVIISCLGLFGLAAFSAEQRTKEIGIRKVLGASEAGIIALLSKDFLKLVVIAIVISIPGGWYLMNRWLEGFVYRTNISWEIFLIAAVAAVLIAMITISFQAVRAALANPVKSIKYE